MNSTSPAVTQPFARPPRIEQSSENRGSVLRASILESALELGVGSNRTVANWIFNPVAEGNEVGETENEGVVSPSLTYASTATSEESNLSAGYMQPSQPGAGILLNSKESQLSLDNSVQYSLHGGLSSARATPEPGQRGLHFDLRATPEPRAISPAPSPQPPTHTKNKLRKARPDGYESDAGYMSEGGKAKKEKKEKEKERKAKEKEKEKEKKKSKKKGKGGEGEGQAGATDYESDGAYLSESSWRRKKSKKEKKEKSKTKDHDSPTTDYDTDKGYSSSFSRSRSRKQSTTSPMSGDESDGGYLSESSSKKKRFFRLNSKSRKKQDSFDSAQDQPPPVPALPTLVLPIHEKFSRANTPVVSDSRTTTPSPIRSDSPNEVRPSVETITSMATTTSADTSGTADTSSTTVESRDRDSLLSNDGLTRAFQDAESVRSPSTDFLSTFCRPSAGGSSLSPSRFNPFAHSERPNSPLSPKSPSGPALNPSKSVRSRPKISAPNTTALAPKHIPVPLTLTPPTPTASSHPNRIPPSPDPDYVLVTPNPSTPNGRPSEGNRPNSTSSTNPPQAPPSPTLQRPHVLAYYDLPPPSPPPRGPLPDVPSDISRSTSPSWSVMDSSPSRFPRSAPADTNDPRGIQHQHRPGGSLGERPNTSAPHPLSREIAHDVPTIGQPVPPALRGRVSPFPTAPVLPREQTTQLMRQTSKLTRDAVNRALHHNMPASASPYTNGHRRWPSDEDERNGPASAQPYLAGESRWPTMREQQVGGVHRRQQQQQRSASAMDTRRPFDTGPEPVDDGQSWLVYDDEDDETEKGRGGDQLLSVPARPHVTFAESPEPSPDVNAILAGFRAQRDAEMAVRKERMTRSDMLSTKDTLAGIVASYERDTVYLDADEGGGDRSSVWSEANSRYSFLDGEKSAAIREKFVKRVEAMYGKETVPPVPRLGPGVSSGSG